MTHEETIIDVTSVRKRVCADGSMKFTIHTRDGRKFMTTAFGASEHGGLHRVYIQAGRIVSIEKLGDN